MTYTASEKQQIHANIEKATAFLLEIAKKLGEHFDFTFDKQKRYSLVISFYGGAPTITGWKGCNYSISFKRSENAIERTIFDDCDVILDFCVAILCEWENIKNAIQEEIARQNEIRELIENFEI